METTAYELTAMPIKLIYGASASLILNELADRYEKEAGFKPQHWVMRVYSNGAMIPAPTQLAANEIPECRVRQLFKQTLDKITHVGMQVLNEADKFGLTTASNRLSELNALKAA
tara:strand:+ start:2324 stop:2665 length:342 start_codon:yes stop_codon:yes gene_type:complete